ncbi:MAG: hypothetical protein J6X18_09575 [Bacteroidales bacterium]|nr:hypothetical protein [Bacteroidales bacterium]
MADKVQLIKQEIERRISNLEQIGDREEIEIHFPEQFNFIKMYERLLQFIDSLPEERNEDLEEELHSWMKENCDNNGFFNQLELAHHFAEWQKRHMKEALQTEYEKGRFDMREELMEDAVDAKVYLDLDGNIKLDCEYEFHVGDKVKIIILKTE